MQQPEIPDFRTDSEGVLESSRRTVAETLGLTAAVFGSTTADAAYSYQCGGQALCVYPPAQRVLLTTKPRDWIEQHLVDSKARKVRSTDGFRDLFRSLPGFPSQIVPVAGKSYVVQSDAPRTGTMLMWRRAFHCAARKDGCPTIFTVGQLSFLSEVCDLAS